MQTNAGLAANFSILCSLLLCSLSIAQTKPKEIKVTPESLMVRLPQGATAEATLTLTNTTKSKLSIELASQELIHSDSNQIGFVRFLKDGQEVDRIVLELTATQTTGSEQAIKVKLTHVQAIGTYAGKFVFRNLTSGTEQMIKVQVTKLKRHPFGIELRGVEEKEGKVELKATSKDTIFHFSVKNPDNGLYRKLKLNYAPTSPLKCSIQPDTLTLEAGEQRTVALACSSIVCYETLTGVLSIADEIEPNTRKDFTIVLKSSCRLWTNIVTLAILVFLGSGFSVIVGTTIPRTLQKLKNRRQLQELDTTIREHTESGSAISVKLAVVRNKLMYLNDDIKWYRFNVTERFQEISRLMGELEADLKVVEEVKHLHDRVEQTAIIPGPLEAEVEEHLEMATHYLLEGDREKAKAEVEAAKKIYDEKSALDKLQEDLTNKIKALDTVSSEIEWINGLIKDLLALVTAGKVPFEKLKEADRKYSIVDIYLIKFQKGVVARYPKFKAKQEALLDPLKRGVVSDAALQEAADLIRAMELDLIEETITDIDEPIIDDIRQGKGRIEFNPPDPITGQVVTFRFTLDCQKKNESFLAQRLRYEWDFGDNTTIAVGKERIHYFREDKLQPGYNVTVTIKDRVGNEIRKYGENPTVYVQVKPPRDKKYHMNLSLVEGFIFSTVFIIAVVFAFTVHFDEIKQFQSLKDYLTPFLWGFGLDQGKNTFMSAYKTLTERAVKVE